MLQNYKNGQIYVFLSPHIDDIAFSISGSLRRIIQKNTSYLVNIFSKTNYYVSNFDLKSMSVGVQRKTEDKLFIKRFKLKPIYLDHDDSSVLGHTSVSELICSHKDFRNNMVRNSLINIFNIIKPDIVFCPLAIGGHIDHRMLKDELVNIIEICKKVYFYEDLPYSCEYKPTDLLSIINKTFPFDLFPEEIDISNNWLEKKECISFYESQLDKNTINLIKDYATKFHKNSLVERFWRYENKQ